MKLEDYDVKIPTIVMYKIAEEIDVEVSIKLKEVIVSITKIKENIKNSPFAISSKSFSKFQSTAQQFYLSEYIEVFQVSLFQMIIILHKTQEYQLEDLDQEQTLE